jgi:hypothetical protein
MDVNAETIVKFAWLACEAENVSKTTVENDLKEATVQGVDSSPAGGVVKGKDEKIRKAAATVVCKRCKRLNVPVKNCKQCEAGRAG